MRDMLKIELPKGHSHLQRRALMSFAQHVIMCEAFRLGYYCIGRLMKAPVNAEELAYFAACGTTFLQ